MLLVGAQNWLRAHGAPVQTHDIHLLFHPHSAPHWTIGAVSIDRKSGKALYHKAEHYDINEAHKQLLTNIKSDLEAGKGHDVSEHQRRLLDNSIYRMGKLSHRDILGLEPYETSGHSERLYAENGNPGYKQPGRIPGNESK